MLTRDRLVRTAGLLSEAALGLRGLLERTAPPPASTANLETLLAAAPRELSEVPAYLGGLTERQRGQVWVALVLELAFDEKGAFTGSRAALAACLAAARDGGRAGALVEEERGGPESIDPAPGPSPLERELSTRGGEWNGARERRSLALGPETGGGGGVRARAQDGELLARVMAGVEEAERGGAGPAALRDVFPDAGERARARKLVGVAEGWSGLALRREVWRGKVERLVLVRKGAAA